MFGLSGWEIAIIALFGFMIFGPDRLPQIARTAGRAIRQFRSAQEQMNQVIKAEVYDPIKDLEPLANPFAGFSLDGSASTPKASDKKPSAAKADAKTTAKTTAKADGKLKAGADAKGDSSAEDKKVPSDDLKVALSQEAEKAREKAKGSTTKATSATSASAPPSESFAQRRARLEREHAEAKAAKAAGSAPSSTERKEDGTGA